MDRPLPRVSGTYRLATLLMVVVPPLALVLAIVMLWQVAIQPVHLALLVVLYLLTGMGITIGYHRLFTHRSFETYAPIRLLLAVLGQMAAEGPVSTWVANHRKHHALSDRQGDPHSPHDHDGGFWQTIRGFFHAHFVWFLTDTTKPDITRYAPDLERDPITRFVDRTSLLWVALGLLIPAAIAGLFTGTWTGAFLGLLWGGLVRLMLVHHVTWSVNSVCHIWGTRGFRCADESRNNFIVGVLAMGEGWHNNHHAFPTSARHGLKWWQLDISYITIRLMSLCRLAWAVRTPSRERLVDKQIELDRSDALSGGVGTELIKGPGESDCAA